MGSEGERVETTTSVRPDMRAVEVVARRLQRRNRALGLGIPNTPSAEAVEEVVREYLTERGGGDLVRQQVLEYLADVEAAIAERGGPTTAPVAQRVVDGVRRILGESATPAAAVCTCPDRKPLEEHWETCPLYVGR